MLVNLARALVDEGCRSVVGVFEDPRCRHTEVAWEAIRRGLPIELIRCKGRVDSHAVSRIRRLIETQRIDIVHTHGYKADCYGFLAAWPRRVALFATVHNWPDKRLSMRLYAKADRTVLRAFDRIAVVSDVVAGILRRSGISAELIEIVRNGVRIDDFACAEPTLRTEYGWSGKYVIGFVGRLVNDKGGEVLVRAAKAIMAAHPNARVVFVGDGPARGRWEALAGALGVQSSVRFAGTRSDIARVYASLDVLVLPSLIEAMPMCLIEAMAAAKPVVATRVGAIPRLIDPEVTGLLVEPGDAEGLKAAISRLIEEPSFARRLGENGATLAAARFSEKEMAKSYVRLYRQTMADYRRRSRVHNWQGRIRRLWTSSESDSRSL
jgi:glycosyltransferase involved in cell wall biosynthesis